MYAEGKAKGGRHEAAPHPASPLAPKVAGTTGAVALAKALLSQGGSLNGARALPCSNSTRRAHRLWSMAWSEAGSRRWGGGQPPHSMIRPGGGRPRESGRDLRRDGKGLAWGRKALEVLGLSSIGGQCSAGTSAEAQGPASANGSRRGCVSRRGNYVYKILSMITHFTQPP